jgi:hypothetical protein
MEEREAALRMLRRVGHNRPAVQKYGSGGRPSLRAANSLSITTEKWFQLRSSRPFFSPTSPTPRFAPLLLGGATGFQVRTGLGLCASRLFTAGTEDDAARMQHGGAMSCPRYIEPKCRCVKCAHTHTRAGCRRLLLCFPLPLPSSHPHPPPPPPPPPHHRSQPSSSCPHAATAVPPKLYVAPRPASRPFCSPAQTRALPPPPVPTRFK